jgi:hypothetical protein
MRMDSSSGKSTFRRCAICSGLHAVDHRRSCRWGLFSPFHGGGVGPETIVPSGRRTFPRAGPGRTHASRGLATSFAVFGRLAACWAFHCATVARYSCFPPRSRRCGVTRVTRPRVAPDLAGDLTHALALARRIAISSRSSKLR